MTYFSIIVLKYFSTVHITVQYMYYSTVQYFSITVLQNILQYFALIQKKNNKLVTVHHI